MRCGGVSVDGHPHVAAEYALRLHSLMCLSNLLTYPTDVLSVLIVRSSSLKTSQWMIGTGPLIRHRGAWVLVVARPKGLGRSPTLPIQIRANIALRPRRVAQPIQFSLRSKSRCNSSALIHTAIYDG